MNHYKYRFLFVLVSVVTLITLSVQFYWVFKNYEESTRQLERDIRTSFDLAVKDYYTNEAKRNTLGFFSEDGKLSKNQMDSLIENLDVVFKSAAAKKVSPSIITKSQTPSLQKVSAIKGIKVVKGSDKDTAASKKEIKLPFENAINTKNGSKINEAFVTGMRFEDNEIAGSLKEVSDRIVISFTSNQIDLNVLDSLFNRSLNSYQIAIDYGFLYNDGDDEYNYGLKDGEHVIVSDSPQLYKNTKLKITYAGGESTLWKRNLSSVSLSFLLICLVIFCLFYMLEVIKKQKKLSAIKNDLISNITHEFKTPIATATAALEGMQSFTADGDTLKSDRYLTIGRTQLIKLNLMVEKLLETAAIDNEKLVLQKTKFSLSQMLTLIVDRYEKNTEKNIRFDKPTASMEFFGDEFHLDNAFNNLLDNAIKYGGDSIKISLDNNERQIKISFQDNGKNLRPKEVNLIFDKFYRVYMGDRHDIKGHGIGLFYTKAIIEKHGGSINVTLDPTTFTITLPHG